MEKRDDQLKELDHENRSYILYCSVKDFCKCGYCRWKSEAEFQLSEIFVDSLVINQNICILVLRDIC